jgi:hypothetical protein
LLDGEKPSAAKKGKQVIVKKKAEILAPSETSVTLKRWEQMSGKQLDTIVRGSISEIQVLSRMAQAEARERLLPALQEIKRRFKAGEKVCGYSGIEDYFQSVGVNPNTVRQWEFRIRQREQTALPEIAGQSTPDEAEDQDAAIPQLREPNYHLDGFALDTHLTTAIGRKGAPDFEIVVSILPSTRHPGFWFCDRIDGNPTGGVIEGSWKPIRKDGVLSMLKCMGIRYPKTLEWETGELNSGFDEHPFFKNPWSPKHKTEAAAAETSAAERTEP